MAIFHRSFPGDFDQTIRRIEDGVMGASASATLEESWDRSDAGGRCAVRVFERYSAFGGNRVSMSVTLFQAGDLLHLCAVTSGGSQAMFFKVNTFGEESFLSTLTDLF